MIQTGLPLSDIPVLAASAADSGFVALCHRPVTHATGFAIGPHLRVTFDPSKGGSVHLAGVVPPAGAPHYRLTPIGLGSADWYAVELDLPPGPLAGLASLVPCMDAASPRKLSLFALLRVTGPDGRSHDGASTMVELGPDRRNTVFPVSLSDFPQDTLLGAQSARLIFFLEARHVDLDLYGLSIAGIPLAPPLVVDDALLALRAEQPSAESVSVSCGLSPSIRQIVRTRCTGNVRIAPDVYMDIEAGPDREALLRLNWGRLEFDFTKAEQSAWRTLEFRFPAIRPAGPMTVSIGLEAAVTHAAPVPVGVILRQYASAGGAFHDTPLGAGLRLFPDLVHREFRFDLPPELADAVTDLTLGVMLFLPPDIGLVSTQKIEVALHGLSRF